MCLGILGGCIAVDKNNFPSPKVAPYPDTTKARTAVISQLPLAGDSTIAFGNQKQVYFTNLSKPGTIFISDSQTSNRNKVFIDLNEWISTPSDRVAQTAGIKIDQSDRVLVAESGTGKLLEFHQMQGSWRSWLILMKDTSFLRYRHWKSEAMAFVI